MTFFSFGGTNCCNPVARIGPAGWSVGGRLHLLDLTVVPTAAQQACLSDDERARAARFFRDVDRIRYLSARFALRQALAEEVGVSPRDIAFSYNRFGKPALAGTHRLPFNLSHSGDLGLLLLGGGTEVGVDIEVAREVPDAMEIGQRCFTPAELTRLAATVPELRSGAFLQLWTRKEACLKAVGSGFSIDPLAFDAGLTSEATMVEVPREGSRERVEVQSVGLAGAFGAVARVL